MSKQPRGYFKLEHREQSGTEMVLTAFSMLESRGYTGFTELMSILDDPNVLLKIIRLMYGMEIKVPPLKEFVTVLQAAQYAFCDMHKTINANLPAKPKDIRQFMNIDEEREKELLDVFDEWAKYMYKQGCPIQSYMKVNRNNTKKRIEMAQQGKKWTKKRY